MIVRREDTLIHKNHLTLCVRKGGEGGEEKHNELNQQKKQIIVIEITCTYYNPVNTIIITITNIQIFTCIHRTIYDPPDGAEGTGLSSPI